MIKIEDVHEGAELYLHNTETNEVVKMIVERTMLYSAILKSKCAVNEDGSNGREIKGIKTFGFLEHQFKTGTRNLYNTSQEAWAAKKAFEEKYNLC